MYTLTAAVVKKGHSYPFDLTATEILRIAEFSAPVTHRLGNRRYENIIFRIRKGVVCDLNLAESDKSGKPVLVICLTCDHDGDHCLRCNSTGYITLR